jgi:hypothetical protein
VSAIAALCILPTRRWLALHFRLHPNTNINVERARKEARSVSIRASPGLGAAQ